MIPRLSKTNHVRWERKVTLPSQGPRRWCGSQDYSKKQNKSHRKSHITVFYTEIENTYISKTEQKQTKEYNEKAQHPRLDPSSSTVWPRRNLKPAHSKPNLTYLQPEIHLRRESNTDCSHKPEFRKGGARYWRLAKLHGALREKINHSSCPSQGAWHSTCHQKS